MALTGKYDDKWALRLAYDSTLNAFRFTEVGDSGVEVVSAAGTVTTTPIDLPTSAAGALTDVMIQCGVDNTSTLRLDVSLDGGTTYHRLAPGMTLSWNMSGVATQIKIKSASGTVQYYFTGNRLV